MHVSARILVNGSLLLPPAVNLIPLLPIITCTPSANLYVIIFIQIIYPQAQLYAVKLQ
jgi:hypothetical protein